MRERSGWLTSGRDRLGSWGADPAGLAVTDAIAATGHEVLIVGAQTELAPEAGPREMVLTVRRVLASPHVQVRLRSTLEAVEPDRLLVGHAGHRDWLPTTGPVLVSQGTVPAVPNLGHGDWQLHTIGEAAFADSIATAIHDGTAVSRSIS